jgi:hypothetical protein
MTGFIAICVVALIIICIVAWAIQSQVNQKRADEFGRLAASQGWSFIDEDDSYARRWDGPPFTGRGKVRNIVSGQHRGRSFTAFEYVYTTTTYNGQTNSTQTHRFGVWAVSLPAAVPELSVGSEGIFGGKVAEALGFGRVNIGDTQFDDSFKVKCDDEQFGLRVLHPAVVELLKMTGPWDWRFTGQTMLSFEKGAFEPAALQPRLELMADVLDRVPADVWTYSPYGRG